MPRRRRNKVLIALIGAGLLNFLAYTIIYAMIGGDAKNGRIDEGQCFLRGHFLRLGTEGRATQVSALRERRGGAPDRESGYGPRLDASASC